MFFLSILHASCDNRLKHRPSYEAMSVSCDHRTQPLEVLSSLKKKSALVGKGLAFFSRAPPSPYLVLCEARTYGAASEIFFLDTRVNDGCADASKCPDDCNSFEAG